MATTRNVTYSSAATFVLNITRYVLIGGGLNTGFTTETDAQMTYRSAGTLANLYVCVTTNTLTASTTVRTRKSAVNGNQSISIGSGATGIFEDTVNSDSVAAADKLNYQIVTGATGTSLLISQFATTFLATTNTVKKHVVGANNSSISSASTTSFWGISGTALTTTEANVQYRSRVTGTLTNLQIQIPSNARTTTTTFGSRKNTANGNLTISVGSTATGIFEDTTHSDSVVPTDLINLFITTGTGALVLRYDNLGVELTTTDGSSVFHASNGGTLTVATSITSFIAIDGSGSVMTTESQARNTPRFSFTAGNYQARIVTNTITASSTFSVRQNGTTTGVGVSIGSSATGIFEDTVNSVSIVATDTVDHQIVTGASGTNLAYSLLAITATTGSPPPPTPITFITYRPPWRS